MYKVYAPNKDQPLVLTVFARFPPTNAKYGHTSVIFSLYHGPAAQTPKDRPTNSKLAAKKCSVALWARACYENKCDEEAEGKIDDAPVVKWLYKQARHKNVGVVIQMSKKS